ncbi:ATP-binding cassette domain-containing protein [Amylibacter sp. IMCC11727]|uniref:macrolide ABC transporter ATP-binding protein/permease n=1 Tax=Amylibacter sp. IMCC11727 TaxID=3039851 RepID=UPI00244E42A1|nr:ATP-binding cassette domain-containing protein [Amylibacter sp. IMCC11727]WGI21242.1 ATP-binding cassette domain-containing protein [Amylibacter sp. IMCC11727]
MSDNSIISLKNINRVFEVADERIEILKDLSLDIERGSFNVISGESGSGKTTLLRILGLLDTDYEGEFAFEGTDVAGRPDWYLDELRANNIGFIFQEGRLFSHMSLTKNIEIPLELQGHNTPNERSERIKALEPAFYSEKERAKNTLNNYPSSASGGQAQRASIMRAVVKRPSIILADEPTASLHGELKQEVVAHLRALVEDGHTVIVVSHDEVFYDHGRQLLLENGVLRELNSEPASTATPLPSHMPGQDEAIFFGWKPRAPFRILLSQAIRETVFRPLFLSLILVSLIIGVCQVSVFTSVIVGAQDYVNQKITEGSRLNRIQIKPRIKDKANDDRFPDRQAIIDDDLVDVVVQRRATTSRVVVKSGKAKTFSVTGLLENDPEYDLLNFAAGGPFVGNHDQPQVILTAAMVSEVFDTEGLDTGAVDYSDFIGKRVTVIINRYNRGRKLVGQVPVELELAGVILHGEGGRQLYFPNRTLLIFDRFVRDRDGEYKFPENAGVDNWFDGETIATLTDFPWEDSLHIYAKEIREVLVLYSRLSKMGFKPQSDIWDFKWALDIQDTAWRIFLPLLGLIVLGVCITVAANIFTSAKLRETELALWRVLGMRRGDLVLTQVMSVFFSVTVGVLAGLGLGAFLIEKTRQMLVARALETAQATGDQAAEFDAIFAPVSNFFWPVVICAISIGLLSALYPAFRTAKTDPAKVLKS